MEIQWRRTGTFLLFVALATFLCVRGIVPAVSRVDSDFPNYLTAARIVADRGPVERLYDDSWFQEQMRRYGIGRPVGKFAPFPPPTALLLVPLARLPPLAALRIVTLCSLMCLVFAILLLARILAWRPLVAAVFVLLSGYAITGTLRFGQPYIVIATSCIAGYYAYLRGRPLLGGICLGAFAPIKYFPLTIVACFAGARRWRVVCGALLAMLAVVAVSVISLGWELHATFLSAVLGQHLTAHLGMQDPFSASFQSLDTLTRRLFVFDPSANPRPWLVLPHLQPWVLVGTKLAFLAAALAAIGKIARREAASALAPAIGILGLLTLLLAPATAAYHFTLLWLPVALLVDHLVRNRAPVHAGVVLVCYALIGFFPYRFTAPFEGQGALTVLAYPRLLLLAAMFIAGIQWAWMRTEAIPRDGIVPVATR